MAVTVSLVPTTPPFPVQIVITGIPVGVEYEVVGTAADGSTWPVPGGVGVSTGGQVVLIDNRGALNTSTTYVATWSGTSTSSTPITVEYPGRYVLQSLDGQQVVDFWWLEDGLPQEPVVRAESFQIEGRDRPPVRFASGGDGGGSARVRTALEDSATLRAMVKRGRPVIVRTDGTFRDFPAVELVRIVRAPNFLSPFAAIDARRTDRVWTLEYEFVDDPEPSAVLAAWTWNDFDDAMSTRTWNDHDTLFASSTWDEWDTYPWGQLS